MEISVATHKIAKMLQNASYSDFKDAACKQYFKLAFELDTLDPAVQLLQIFETLPEKSDAKKESDDLLASRAFYLLNMTPSTGGLTPQQAVNGNNLHEEEEVKGDQP
jgi:hypothetical protein